VRILYLTHRLPYAPNRGDRIRAYHMLRHLAARHAVDLVSFVHDDDEQLQASALADVASSTTAIRLRRRDMLTRAAAALASGRTLTHAMLDSPVIRGLLAEIVSANRPDIVLAYCSGMARFAMEPPLGRIPFVVDLVDVDSEKWADLGRAGIGPKHWIYRREARRLRQFERQAMRAARATLVVNARERQSAATIAEGARVEVVANGIDLSRFRPPYQASSAPTVVFCGVMNYAPNAAAAEWLVREVWPHVRAARPDAALTIVGAHPTRRLCELARTDASIEVTGAVPDVRPFLWKAAVAVAPLTVARGLQNKVLEAVAAGLPVIASRAVVEGLPAEVLPACSQADSSDDVVDQILSTLAMAPLERRAIARGAALECLDWRHRLAPLDAILSAALRPVRLTA